MTQRDVVFPAARQALYERNRYSPAIDDVIDVTVFIVDPETKFERIWSVFPEFWGSAPHPTLTGVGVTWLYGFDFEIKVVARLPQTPAQ
ncbi:hypothetical protein SAMN05444506_109103 [Pseudomonas syringae]|nr:MULTISPECIES: Rid family hydrolase [Pseudomonas syringae group]SDZ07332.1 hypothetical protein SAMN05444506_109103 [Pseudomonas syringae]